MAAWLALLPVLTLGFATVAGYQADAEAPLRLALIRGALVTGALGVLSVEALSAVHALSPGPVRVMWALATVVSGLLAARRVRATSLLALWPGRAGWVLAAGPAGWVL